MPIRKLRFSFEVPITELLGLIATSNDALKIDVLGDDKPKLNHHPVRLLEGPKPGGKASQPRQRNNVPGWHVLLKAIAKNPEHTKQVSDLRPLFAPLGLRPSSVNSQMNMMRSRGYLRRLDRGAYQATAKGLAKARELGFSIAEPKSKPKSEPEKPEADNG